jgi:hypothetical protein
MTREDKIQALANMCEKKESCVRCVLRELSTACDFEELTDEVLEQAYATAFPNSTLDQVANPIVPNDNVERHRAICEELNALYAKKNHDYGDSFHLSYMEEGMAMARIRLGDKLNRFKTLSKATEQAVSDESLRDTLIDLANYAIMTILEMEDE